MQQTVERLYVLHGGYAVQPDRSVYTPGRWEKEQIVLPCHAYLIRRAGDWILWDTGIDDSVFFQPGGQIIAHGLRGIVVRPLAQQLDEIGIGPGDISHVILSHGHFDHIGNSALFSHARWHLHRSEHAAMFGREPERFGYVRAYLPPLLEADMNLFDSDLDLFDDGSMTIISTPGHTPGHCSLLVRLRQAGPILLAADVAHYAYNLEHRAVPSFNADHDASVASMDRIAAIADSESAQLWLNHDARQSAGLCKAPSFLD